MFNKLKDKFSNTYSISLLTKMMPYVRPYKKRAILAIVLTIPLGMLDAVIAWSLKPFMDSVMIEKSIETASYVPLIIIGFTFVQAIFGYAAGYLSAWVGTKISIGLKKDMFEKLVNYDSKFFDTHQTGDIIVRFSADVDAACAGLLKNFKLFTTRLFSSLSLIGVLFYHSWQLAIVAIVVLFGALFPLSTFRRRIKTFANQTVKESGKFTTLYSDTVAGNKVIASYNLQNKKVQEFSDAMKRIFRLNMKVVQRTVFLPSLMSFCVSFGIAIIIWYGSYLIVNGEISGGTFVSFIVALIMLYNPIKTIGNNFASVQTSLLAMERVFTLKENTPEIINSENATELKNIKKSIKFNNVSFEYEESKPILANINLEIPLGKVYAFVGNSGGGKSTLVNLLPRFYDAVSGSVEIDGKDIKNVTLNSLRNNIGIVLQDNFLFDGTIRDNITLGEDYTDEAISAAIESACLSEFIESLEEGLDTYVGERGTLLSGGQKQRISIARAFLKNAPIIILDEATSALDNKSEKIVQKAMEELMKDRTVLVIAHRLTTIRNADQIVVINEGKIAEQGSHDELIKNSDGAYSALLHMNQK